MQEQLVEAGRGELAQQDAGVIGPEPQVGRQRRVRLGALRDQAGEQRADSVLEHLAGDQAGIGVRCRQRLGVLAAAEADLKPELGRRARKSGGGVAGERLREGKAGQREVQQRLLPGPQFVAADPAVKAFGGEFSG